MKKTLAIVLSFALVFTGVCATFFAFAGAPVERDLTTGSVNITDSGKYIINQSVSAATANTVIVSGGTLSNPVEITLSGVNIAPNGSGIAIDIQGESVVELTLEGENLISGAGVCSAMFIAPEARVFIFGNGSLDARADDIGGGAGIEVRGLLLVNDGEITAHGGYNAAGIGASSYFDCGSITIFGGTINAFGGDAYSQASPSNATPTDATPTDATPTDLNIGFGGAGIGGGSGSGIDDIAIFGGTVTAVGGGNAAGIGSGGEGLSGDNSLFISLVGGKISAQGGDGASDIGHGALANENCPTSIFVSDALYTCEGFSSQNDDPLELIFPTLSDDAIVTVGSTFVTILLNDNDETTNLWYLVLDDEENDERIYATSTNATQTDLIFDGLEPSSDYFLYAANLVDVVEHTESGDEDNILVTENLIQALTTGESAALRAFLDAVDDLPMTVTRNDIDDIVDATLLYSLLEDSEKALVPSAVLAKLSSLQGQAGVLNHYCNGVSLASSTDLPWYVQIQAEEINEAEYPDTLDEESNLRTSVFGAYSIRLVDLFTGDDYDDFPEGGISFILSVGKDSEGNSKRLTAYYKDVRVIHEYDSGMLKEITPVGNTTLTVTFFTDSCSNFYILADRLSLAEIIANGLEDGDIELPTVSITADAKVTVDFDKFTWPETSAEASVKNPSTGDTPNRTPIVVFIVLFSLTLTAAAVVIGKKRYAWNIG